MNTQDTHQDDLDTQAEDAAETTNTPLQIQTGVQAGWKLGDLNPLRYLSNGYF